MYVKNKNYGYLLYGNNIRLKLQYVNLKDQ